MSDDYAGSTATTGRLLPGGSVSGTVEVAYDKDWFAISLLAGYSYTFNLNSTASGGVGDAYLRLLNSSGGQLAYNDDYGSGYNSQLTYIAPTAGTYYLEASGWSSRTGAYVLSASAGTVADDFAGSSATTGRLTPGGAVTGNVEVAADKDWFAISLVAGYSYTFNLTGAAAGALADPYLSLLDSSGTLLAYNDDSGGGRNSQIVYRANTTGTYFLEARGYSSYTGAYNLTASAPTASDDFADNPGTIGSVTPGGSVSGNVEVIGDKDWFAISLVAGNSYTFNLNSAATAGVGDTYLRLYSGTGSLIAANDDYAGLNSQIIYAAAVSGTYYLEASGYGSHTGGYVLSSTSPNPTDDYAGTSSTTGVLAQNGNIKGAIETAGDHDWFAISLDAGKQYTFTLDPDATTGLSDPYLRLYNSAGNLLASDDDSGAGYGSLITFSAAISGVYYLDAAGLGSSTGRYSLTSVVAAQADDYAESVATTGRLAPGASVSGNIEAADDADWFAITLQAGNRYTFNLNSAPTGGVGDTYLRLYSSIGVELASNDDANGSLNSQIAYAATSTGTYYLSAAGYGMHTGAYTLSATAPVVIDDYAGNTATTGRLLPSGSVSGSIESGGDSDWFAISLQAGNRYSFALNKAATSPLADPYLVLFNSAGQEITHDDDSGGDGQSLISFTATTSGTYYLGARAYGSGVGNYVLSASGGAVIDDYAANTGTVGHLTPGGVVSGVIETNGDNDWFSINLAAGTYTFNLNASASGGLSDPFLRLFNASGTVLASNDDTNGLNSQITFTASTSGTYYLGASGYGANTGAYLLTSSAGSGGAVDDYTANTATTGHLTVGSSVAGRLEVAGDHDWFAVSLAAGTSYQFNLNPASSGGLSDTYLRLLDAAGNVLAFNDDANGGSASQINFSATSSGTYYVDASAYGTLTGNYVLSATSSGSVPSSSNFNIEIDFTGDAAYQHYFDEAAARWEEVITGDMPDVGLIDDLRIDASVAAIDGAGTILAQAGATGLRSASLIPYSGVMHFDSADISNMISKGIFGDVVLHEMGHILGISGYFFQHLGLVDASNSAHYTGVNGLAAYQSVGGASSATYVPLETSGGAGTALSHWSESVFDTELMTGYAENTPPMPLSIVTIGALQDLGYQVNYAQADAFHL